MTEFLIGFAIIIFLITMIHETGHLIAARLTKTRVKIFSIGFGLRIIGIKFLKGKISIRLFRYNPTNSAIWNRTDNTEYRIAPIPFGGFCEMIGELKGTGKEYELVAKPYLQKVFIAIAGALANIISGVVASSILFSDADGWRLGFLRACNGLMYASQIGLKNLYETLLGKVEIYTFKDISQAPLDLTFINYVWIFSIVSVFMAIINLIPFPALDGSLPFLWGLEKILGKQWGGILAAAIAKVGFIVLMLLQVFLLFLWFFC